MLSKLLLAALPLCLTLALPAQVIPRLTGDVYDGNGGPLSQGVYHAGNFRVPAGRKLTIGQANIKFESRATLTVDGELDVSKGAYFTSVRDDLIGGDTNGDGGATVPAAGDWVGIRISSGAKGAVFASFVIRYAGLTGTGIAVSSSGAVSPPLTMSQCQVLDIRGAGIDLGYSEAKLDNVLFSKCRDVAARGQFFLLDKVINNFARDCGGNYIERLGNAGAYKGSRTSYVLEKRQTLNGSGVAVVRGSLDLPTTGKLVIQKGLVLKFPPSSGYRGKGDLETQGTSSEPVIFTSIKDDTAGGDTNGDQAATKPAPGDWNNFMSSGSGGSVKLAHTEIRYSGASFQGSMWIQNMNLMMDSCTVRDGKGYGVQLLSHNQTLHTLTNCRFENVEREVLRGIALDSLSTCFGNVQGPGTQTQIIADGVCRQNARLTLDNVPGRVIHLQGALQSDSGTTLTIGPGLAFKLQSQYATGSLNNLRLLGTAQAPIVLTSIHDDAVGGDTNGNGNATTPQPGNWSGLRFLRSTNSLAQNVTVKYAGTAVRCQSPNAEIRRVAAEHFGTYGFWIDALKGDLDSVVAVNGNGTGVRFGTTATNLRHASIAYNGGYGVLAGSGSAWTGRIRNSILWSNTQGAQLNLTQSHVQRSCGLFPGVNGNINVDPLFADKNTLTLATASPCINAGELATGVSVALDIWERSRVCDWDFSGQVLPDMGAYEQLGMFLQSDPATPGVGDTIRFRVVPVSAGNSGAAVFFLGFQDFRLFFKPYGMLNAGLATLTPFAFSTTGQQVPLVIPSAKNLVGLEIAVQGLGIPTAKPTRGNFTDLYRAILRR